MVKEKNPPAVRETWVQPLDWEDPLDEGMATHSSVLAWRIPMDRVAWHAIYSPWSRKELDMDTTEQKSTAQHIISLRIIHVVECVRISFLFKIE